MDDAPFDEISKVMGSAGSRRRMIANLLAVVLGSGLVLPEAEARKKKGKKGKKGNAKKRPCQTSGQCPLGRLCDTASGRCFTGCRSSADCPKSNVCSYLYGDPEDPESFGSCVPACASNFDCALYFRCMPDGQCVPIDCYTDSDCPDGQFCLSDFMCFDPG